MANVTTKVSVTNDEQLIKTCSHKFVSVYSKIAIMLTATQI